jgi:hypothetical protein
VAGEIVSHKLERIFEGRGEVPELAIDAETMQQKERLSRPGAGHADAVRGQCGHRFLMDNEVVRELYQKGAAPDADQAGFS